MKYHARKQRTHRWNSQQHGVSLVELMIAMTLGLMMIGGTISIFSSSQRVYTTTETLSRLQENARFAFGMLTRDIRMAGYMGCASAYAPVTNTLNPLTPNTKHAYNFDRRIEGFETHHNNANWAPAMDASIIDPLEGRDVITLRTVSGGGAKVTNHAPGSASIQITPSIDLDKKNIVMVSDCISSAIFQITNDNPETNIVHNTGGTEPGNATQNLGKSYKDGELIKLSTMTYYIRTGAGGYPALWRKEGTDAAEEWVEGVEQMQITYGVDTDQDQDMMADQYVTADDVPEKAPGVPDWARVVSVTINLLMATVSDKRIASEKENDFTFNSQSVTLDNYRLGKIFSTTITLRNRVG